MPETKQSPIQETLESMRAYLHDNKYTTGSLGHMQHIWDRISEYATANGYLAFSEEWVFPFIDAYIESLGKSIRYDKIRVYYRAGQMLCDYQKHGKIRRITGIKKLINDAELYKPLYDAADTYAIKHQLHKDTKTSYVNEMNKLVIFLERSAIKFDELSFDVIHEYLTTLNHLKQSSIALIHTILRNIFTILYREGTLKHDLAAVCEKIRIPANRNIPSVLTPEDTEKVLSAVDRANAAGKRDYAILLLAARLGMRVSDIRSLRFDNMNWNACEIRLTQTKTKKEIALPLSEEVGFAIIDYVKNGRPKSDSQHIFIRHIPPFTEFAESGNFSQLLIKYLQRAGVKIPHGNARGMHTLRHSLASNMLAEGTALPVVSEILGHSKTDTTMIYLKISIPQLRQCSLDADFGGVL